MGKRPLQSREGGSKFVSQDVYLSVETMKSEIVETFGAGSQLVAFSPVTGDDVPLAKQATSYSEYVVHRQNKGLTIFEDVVHDGLNTRVGLAEVFWDQRVISAEYPPENSPIEHTPALLLNPKDTIKG